jgi:septum formation protein
MLPAELILGSTSRYRAELLQRLRQPFKIVRPEVDETALPMETPYALARRLAHAQCCAVHRMHPDSIVIGADQVADRLGECVGKPGERATAISELQKNSGRVLMFHSAVCVRWQTHEFVFVHTTHVEFRTLTHADICSYVDAEQPYDCAGSLKSEGLGISLLQRIESTDPTGLIGLPLIQLSAVLRQLAAI